LIYNPTEPIYRQTRQAGSYSAFLFFQAMKEAGGTTDGINNWVSEQESTSIYAQERKRLSNIASFDADFDLFAQLYSIDGIHDFLGGQYLQTKDTINPTPLAVPSMKKRAEERVTVSIVPFTIPLYKVQLPAGNSFNVLDDKV
jgi:hypothetical protein